MALSPLIISSSKPLFLFLLICTVNILSSRALDFDVGSEAGWAVPHSKEPGFYNEWASDNRFRVGDTVHFKYKKDSVMVVSEDEYEKCRSAHPVFFSNSGEAEFELDRSGTFYFISGVAGHCERGQKMIIKVLSHSEGSSGSPAPGSSSRDARRAGNSTSPGSNEKSGGGGVTTGAWGLGMVSVNFIAFLFASIFW